MPLSDSAHSPHDVRRPFEFAARQRSGFCVRAGSSKGFAFESHPLPAPGRGRGWAALRGHLDATPDNRDHTRSGAAIAQRYDGRVTDESVLHQVHSLPERPGVYIMRDVRGDVIYIGKATSLRNRVRSYFGSARGLEPKVRALAEQVHVIEHVVTRNEAEALHLEATLVKRHQPIYNVRLKDDKHYPYLKVDVQHPWPRVTITRRVEDDGSRYFGPYASAGSVRRTLDVVKKLFPRRSCTKEITGTDPRPCLDYYIKRCIAPCTAYCTPEEYAEVISETILFLEGRSDEVRRHVIADMERASDALDFERAARLRDQVEAIRRVTERQQMATTTPLDADVFALARQDDEACVQVFFVRGTAVADTDSFMLEGTQDVSDADVLGAFLAQFYESTTYVPLVLLLPLEPTDREQIETMLREQRGRSVEVAVPVRGERRALVTSAEDNARESLRMHHVRWVADRDKTESALSMLQAELDLPTRPNRIECYDISTIQGTNSVASMVVFRDGHPATAQYRRFRIKTVEGQDDFASMREVLGRRFKRIAERRRRERVLEGDEAAEGTPAPEASIEVLVDESVDGGLIEEAPEEMSPWDEVPDLVIIDGGKGQLGAVLDVMRDLGLRDVPVCGLAKREEEIFVADVSDSIVLPRQSEALYLVQRIRDEAHRFAITYHRNLRGKAATQSILDAIPGVGPVRKRALLRKFGSVKAIREADVSEIAATVGFTQRLAETIKRSL
ncbi:MAG: excinuclease ABC subunit UvrC [Chloroflexi bacterium]|nr:MAG: excinuclease ABC subunit UvrC [Chloroflexota bacterium]